MINLPIFNYYKILQIKMKVSLETISDIKIGFPGLPEKEGRIPFLQVRQFDDEGKLIAKTEDFIKLDERTLPHLLKDGDVLFVAKGFRLFAWCYENDDVPSVASSSFFVIRTKKDQLHPGYLAAFLNAPQTQAVLTQLGGGTNIFSIRKSELGAFQIPLLPMAKQKKVAALSELHQKDIQLRKEIIGQKRNLYRAIISKLIK